MKTEANLGDMILEHSRSPTQIQVSYAVCFGVGSAPRATLHSSWAQMQTAVIWDRLKVLYYYNLLILPLYWHIKQHNGISGEEVMALHLPPVISSLA